MLPSLFPIGVSMLDRLQGAGRLLRTVRHLQYSQLLWRTRYLLERRMGNLVHKSPLSPLDRSDSTLSIPTISGWSEFAHASPPNESASRERIVSQLSAGVFEHLNLQRGLGIQPTNWLTTETSAERLWVVTLHYHEWVYDLALAASHGDVRATNTLETLLSDWLDHCTLDQPGARNLVWNSYAIATRLGWWHRAFPMIAQAGISSRLQHRMAQSAWEQSAFLFHHLEWDLRGNHLLRDGVGLAWSGRAFEGEQPRIWSETATQIALSQAAEQVLADGGHFERSPMYHLHAFEDFLTLEQLLTDAKVRENLQSTLTRMGEFIRWMRHPDGSFPLFNDAASGPDCSPATALHHCQTRGLAVSPELPRGGKYFSQTGIVAWHDPNWSLFFDVGEVGPTYQPGHAHADTLTIEASLHGKRLIVDPGTYHYDRSRIRDYDRSTAAHNTVCIDRQNSSETWDIFRVGRRAKPQGVHVDIRPDGLRTEGSHDGYDHLPGRPRHQRLIHCQSSELRITDSLTGQGTHHASGGFLIAPDWEASPLPCGWLLRQGETTVRVHLRADQPVDLSIQSAAWHPEFGREQLTQRLVWNANFLGPLQVETRFVPETCRPKQPSHSLPPQ